MPVVPAVSQSTLPQAQSEGSAKEPSMMEQVGNRLHLIWDRSQCMPVVSAPVQTALPQIQGAALLGADPSVFVQAGAVRVQMHVSSVEQDNVEEVSVLNRRDPQGYFQHPRGWVSSASTSAVVSPHPNTLAPSSHSAWLPTHAHPILSVQRPDVRASNPFAAFANVRHLFSVA